jgi:two-component system CheB/CheR fusion protein
MLLSDLARPAGPGAMEQVAVIGSDVDAQALAVAEAGRYLAQSAEAVRAVLREPCGGVRDGWFEVDPALRGRVVFRREDLTSPQTDPARHDLICCRNLLIFLGREGQRRVLDAACRALRPGGILALGRTESLVALPDASLEPVDLMHRLYRRVR